MIIKTSPPKYVQVADYLRQRIVSGELGPGDRLATVRALSSMFSVSRQIVESSFDLLDKENLLVRNGRRGVYVNGSRYSAGTSMLYLLAYDVVASNRYLNEIMRITCPPFLRDNCTFTARVIPVGMTSERMLDEELARISSTVGITCVLVTSALKDEKTLRKMLDIRFPVIFLGDFKVKAFKGMPYNQIVYDNSGEAADAMRYLVERNHRHIALVIGNRRHYFNESFAVEVERQAMACKVRVTVIETPSGMREDADLYDVFYRAKLGGLVKGSGKIDAVLLAGAPQASLIEILKSNGLAVPRDVSVFSTSENARESLTCVESDFSVLFDEVYRRVGTIGTDKVFGRISLKRPFGVVDKGTVAARAGAA